MSRKQQVLKLINEMFNGSQSEFAKAIGRKPGQVNHWVNEYRNIGDGLAANIETKFDLPRGWMDSNHDVPGSASQKIADESVIFDRLEITAKLGNGAYNNDHPSIVEQIKVTPEWAHKHIGNNLSAINLINASGDSMQGTIEDGDILFIDTAVRHYISEGIYAFTTADNALRVKRLKMTVKGDLHIISDNPAYGTEILTGEDIHQIQICGKVVAHSAIEKL